MIYQHNKCPKSRHGLSNASIHAIYAFFQGKLLEFQEYVDHSSTLYKFYVLGEKVYHAVKNSTPNADNLMKISGSNEPKPLLFDRWCMFLFPSMTSGLFFVDACIQ